MRDEEGEDGGSRDGRYSCVGRGRSGGRRGVHLPVVSEIRDSGI